MVKSVESQLEYRINNTIALLNSLVNSQLILDPTVPYTQKAAALTKYSDSFGYMMICITDKDVNV